MNTNPNPFDLFTMASKSGNPQQFVINLLKQKVGGNPFFDNLLNLAQNNQTSQIENIARNYFSERGRDFDKEFNDFKNKFNLN